MLVASKFKKLRIEKIILVISVIPEAKWSNYY